MRLALAWLSMNDVAEERQIERFCACVTTPSGTLDKNRARDVEMYLNCRKLVAGQPG